jgi:predicted permease
MPVVTLAEATVGDARRPVGLLLAGAAVLLLIACANVAHLMSARGMGRAREFAVRRAMGAGGVVLTFHLLVESLLLGLGGGAVGAGLAWLAVRALHARAPVDIPRLAEVSVDPRALAAAFAVSTLTAVVFGLLPTLGPLVGRPLAPTLRGGDRASTSGPGMQRLRGMMVVAEIALSLVLVIQAGLLARSLGTLNRVDPGFRLEGLWRAELPLGSGEADEGVQRMAAIRDAVAARPGVRGVSYGVTLPLEWTGGPRCCQAVRVAASVGAASATLTWLHPVGHDYFDVLGIPMLEGGSWERDDVGPDPAQVVINPELARAIFGTTDGVVGRTLAVGSTPVLVVGLAGPVRHYGLDVAHGPALYSAPTFLDRASLVVRADPGLDVARAIREAVWSVEPDLPVPTVESMEALERRSTVGPRFDSVLIGAFSAVALLLAAGGLAGTLFFLVGERRREIGIRMTLGATGHTVVAEVVRRGLLWTASGIVLGLGGGLAAARLLEDRLFGVSTTDTITLVATSTLLLVVALGASWLPARNAARTDPLDTLRTD